MLAALSDRVSMPNQRLQGGSTDASYSVDWKRNVYTQKKQELKDSQERESIITAVIGKFTGT